MKINCLKIMAMSLIFYVSIMINLMLSRKVAYVSNPSVENCVACKFIWENVEESLVDSTSSFIESEGRRNPILAAQSFQYFCRIAPDIFFEPCNNMFEKLFFMTQDFCAKKKVIDICVNNDMCPN